MYLKEEEEVDVVILCCHDDPCFCPLIYVKSPDDRVGVRNSYSQSLAH